MKRNKVLDLVEALRGNREKVSILFGFLAVGFLALSIYIFGTQAKFSWVTFPAYIISTVLSLYGGYKIWDKNAWYGQLIMFINGFQMMLALAGWIWVLYLAQENPGIRYTALVNLPFYYYILFFLIIFLTTFASFMFSMVGLRPKNKKQSGKDLND
ncbi:MAG: hypothetical protein C0410_12320 [Anaerolinea sp.]|nr:hypothetical protein [Anaerolinea sp.]